MSVLLGLIWLMGAFNDPFALFSEGSMRDGSGSSPALISVAIFPRRKESP